MCSCFDRDDGVVVDDSSANSKFVLYGICNNTSPNTVFVLAVQRLHFVL